MWWSLRMYGMEQPGPIQCEYLLTRQGIVTSLEGFVSIELVSFSVKNNAFPYWPGTGLNLMTFAVFSGFYLKSLANPVRYNIF